MDQNMLSPRTPSAQLWKARRWRGHWLCCFGPACGPEDCAGCCLGYACLSVAYSWNLSKILHLSFWRQLVKALCVLAVPAVIYMGVLNGKVVACMPVVDVDPATGELLLRARDAAACSALSALEPIAWLLLTVGGLCWALYLGGANRRRMRLELGIPLTSEGRCCSPCHNDSTYCNDDCCLHFWCPACATCQETRTILHEEACGSIRSRLLDGGYSSGLLDRMPLLDPPAVLEADANSIKPSKEPSGQMQLPV